MNKQQQIKIFITDDHPVVVRGISCMLSKQPDMKVVGSASSGLEMFQALPKAKPTLLLLDLNMPGTDFYENISWVKQHSPWVKIIIYSGYYSPELVKSLMQEGVRGFVAKTSSPGEIIEAILTVCEGKPYVAPPANSLSDNCQPFQHELQDDFRKRLSLSKREQEVLELISKGFSSQSIGKSLYISKHTVETHRKNILRKLDFNTSTELVKFAVQQGLV